MLEKRETALRRRREYVEKLITWHQRLDVEEEKVEKMEQIVVMISTSSVYNAVTPQADDSFAAHPKRLEPLHHLSSSTVQSSLGRTSNDEKHQKHFNKIEESLRTLQNISARSISSANDDIVEVSGRHLNKLWKRLTGETEAKFDPPTVYELRKADLEKLYEEAKMVVLSKFAINNDFKKVIDVSTSFVEEGIRSSEKIDNPSTVSDTRQPDVPTLDLKTSEEEGEQTNQNESDQGYYFSTEDNVEPSNENTSPPATASPSRTEESHESATLEQQSPDTEDSQSQAAIETIEEIVESPSANETIQSAESERREDTNAVDRTVLIADTSFPQIDISSISDTVQSEVSPERSLEQREPSEEHIPTEAGSEEVAENQSDSPIQTNLSGEETRSSSSSGVRSVELEKRLIDLDESLKDLHEAISRSPVFGTNESGTRSEESISTETQKSAEADSLTEVSEQNKENVSETLGAPDSEPSVVVPIKINSKFSGKADGPPLAEIGNRIEPENALETFSPPKYGGNLIIDYHKMPEAEALRRPPASLESEVRRKNNLPTEQTLTVSLFPGEVRREKFGVQRDVVPARHSEQAATAVPDRSGDERRASDSQRRANQRNRLQSNRGTARERSERGERRHLRDVAEK